LYSVVIVAVAVAVVAVAVHWEHIVRRCIQSLFERSSDHSLTNGLCK